MVLEKRDFPPESGNVDTYAVRKVLLDNHSIVSLYPIREQKLRTSHQDNLIRSDEHYAPFLLC